MPVTQADMTANPPLSPERLPPPIIEPVEAALIAPVAPGDGLDCGVFRANGSFCELSRTRISDSRFTARPARPDPAQAKRLEGRYLFGGIGRHHFGHFLMESIARLWAMEGRAEHFDGLIMLPFAQTDFGSVLRRRLLAIFEILGVDMPLHLVKTPVIAEHLMIPAQGFGHLQWAVGTEDFRDFVRARVARHCPAQGPEKIYVSRSKLKHAHQRVDQEHRIEALMQEAGYTIFHPQRHPIMAQAQVYRAARVIVGGDGSAFHFAPFAMEEGTRVGLIQRRARTEPMEAITAQIRAFVPVELKSIRAMGTAETAANQPDPVDFPKLREKLGDAGFL